MGKRSSVWIRSYTVGFCRHGTEALVACVRKAEGTTGTARQPADPFYLLLVPFVHYIPYRTVPADRVKCCLSRSL